VPQFGARGQASARKRTTSTSTSLTSSRSKNDLGTSFRFRLELLKVLRPHPATQPKHLAFPVRTTLDLQSYDFSLRRLLR